jgi:hypothetical protein
VPPLFSTRRGWRLTYPDTPAKGRALTFLEQRKEFGATKGASSASTFVDGIVEAHKPSESISNLNKNDVRNGINSVALVQCQTMSICKLLK